MSPGVQAKSSSVSSYIHLLCIYGKGIIAKLERGPSSSLGIFPLSETAGVGELGAAGVWDVCHGAGTQGAEPCPFWCSIHREHRGHNRDSHRGGGAGVWGSCLPQDQVRLGLGHLSHSQDWAPSLRLPAGPSHRHKDDAKSQEDAVPKRGRAMCSLWCQHGSVSLPLLYWKAEFRSLLLQ